MNDDDRKFLTEWGGEKWNTKSIPDPGPRAKLYEKVEYWNNGNRTFDNWTDFGFVWLKICQSFQFVILINFLSWLTLVKGIGRLEWETTPPADRCQLICDFLREGRT